ncbi:hypothetical protein PFISCL1PPCAC_26006, partial [Pristionchus fissidentatus]
LAIAISYYQTDPSLLRRIVNNSPYEKSLRKLIKSENVNEEKEKMIVTHYDGYRFDKGTMKGKEKQTENNYDLFASISNILDKLYKSGSKVKIFYDCEVCDRKNHSVMRYQFEPSEVSDEMDYSAILKRCVEGYSLCKNKVQGKACNGPRTNVRVEVQKDCWQIDMDISVIFPRRDNSSISDIPNDIEVGETTFRLAGIVLYNDIHYVALIPFDGKWIYYDGLMRRNLMSWMEIKDIPKGFRTSNIFYIRND